MDRDAALARVREIEAEHARLHAEQAALLVRIAGSSPIVEELLVHDPRPGRDEERTIRIADAAREEIAAYLRWSPATAHARIDEARLLAGPLSGTAEALRRGEISPRHVAEITECARRLPGRHARTPHEARVFAAGCAALEARVLPVARRGTVAMTRTAARRAVLAIDAAGEARRRREARCTRDVWVTDELDGLSTLVARLGTEQAHAVLAAVRQQAETSRQHVSATAGEARAAALVDLALRRSRAGDADAKSGGVQVRLDVVVPLDALLGDDGDGHIDLRGAGPLPAGTLADLLDDPTTVVTLRRLVADPATGHLLDVGRRSYAIPDRLRELIVMRDRTCRFFGCGRRADSCQIDHAVAWDDGGRTDRDNLGALCTRHHQLKTHGGWAIIASGADGSCTWRSPSGRRYDHHPPPPF